MAFSECKMTDRIAIGSLRHVWCHWWPEIQLTVHNLQVLTLPACDLGVLTDSRLTMVASVCRSAYYKLQQIRLIVLRSLSDDAAKTLVQVFISSGRLEYCNAVLYGISVATACSKECSSQADNEDRSA